VQGTAAGCGGPWAAFSYLSGEADNGLGEGCCISVEPRINERIRAPQVRVVGADGEQLGVMDVQAAHRLAGELDLDLVEVAPTARPPVCKLMDYSKYKYEQAIKAKEARRKQSLVVLKEMKMRPKIDPHDYATKKGHVERFLKQGHKVKVTIMFRGREMAHTELGRRLLERLATDIADIAQVDSPARQDGRNMIAVFSPRKGAAPSRGGAAAGGSRGAPADSPVAPGDQRPRPVAAQGGPGGRPAPVASV
jgi:translation initiation factor IF-3